MDVWIYDISIVDTSFDGILAVKFVHKEADGDFVVLFMLFVPWELNTSPWC